MVICNNVLNIWWGDTGTDAMVRLQGYKKQLQQQVDSLDLAMATQSEELEYIAQNPDGLRREAYSIGLVGPADLLLHDDARNAGAGIGNSLTMPNPPKDLIDGQDFGVVSFLLGIVVLFLLVLFDFEAGFLKSGGTSGRRQNYRAKLRTDFISSE